MGYGYKTIIKCWKHKWNQTAIDFKTQVNISSKKHATDDN